MKRALIPQSDAYLVWEWCDAPEWACAESPTPDDVSFLVVLPEGDDGKVLPWWLEELGDHIWKKVLRDSGRILVAICHA